MQDCYNKYYICTLSIRSQSFTAAIVTCITYICNASDNSCGEGLGTRLGLLSVIHTASDNSCGKGLHIIPFYHSLD